MTEREDEDERNGAFHKFNAKTGMEFSVEAVERLELVGRLQVERWHVDRVGQPPEKPFPLGSLVKPRSFAPVVFSGPCVVMECLREPLRFQPPNGGVEGYLFDLRVGTNCPSGHIHSLLVESWMFEPYAGIPLFGAAKAQPPSGGII